MLRILTHTVHTSYEYEMTKIPGVEIYAVHLGASVLPKEPWSEWMRPMPDNYHVVDLAEVESWPFDVVIVHTLEGYDAFKHLPLPLIYKVHTIDAPWRVIPEMQDRVAAFVFNQKEACDAWMVEEASKKYIIDHSIDFQDFKGWQRDVTAPLITTGSFLAHRHDKGTSNIIAVDALYGLTVLGGWNDDLNVRKIVKPRSMAEYIALLQAAGAYFCPGPGFSMAALEAMCVGVPIITMPTQNLSDFLVHERNCFVANDVGEVSEYLNTIKKYPSVAIEISEQARLDIMQRYNPLKFQQAWESVIHQVTPNKNNG